MISAAGWPCMLSPSMSSATGRSPAPSRPTARTTMLACGPRSRRRGRMVRAADEPGFPHRAPVAAEGPVDEAFAVADRRDGERAARPFHRAPVDVALVVRDVHALHRARRGRAQIVRAGCAVRGIDLATAGCEENRQEEQWSRGHAVKVQKSIASFHRSVVRRSIGHTGAPTPRWPRAAAPAGDATAGRRPLAPAGRGRAC